MSFPLPWISGSKGLLAGVPFHVNVNLRDDQAYLIDGMLFGPPGLKTTLEWAVVASNVRAGLCNVWAIWDTLEGTITWEVLPPNRELFLTPIRGTCWKVPAEVVDQHGRKAHHWQVS